ncbi:MAG TPA: hypothetical protein VFY56_03440 [Propionibacteriaceae bacterium]|nr:hypothetical protein [Propionibacteriaceae bacterium]
MIVEQAMAAIVAGTIILPCQPSFAAILAIGVIPLIAYPYWSDARTFCILVGWRVAPVAHLGLGYLADLFLLQTLSRWQDQVAGRLDGVWQGRLSGEEAAGEQERGKAVSERLLEAINAHDLEGQLA